MDTAELLIKNAEIYTMNDDMPKAEAIAVKGNKIIGVGKFEDMRQCMCDETQIIDAQGKMMIPGIIDSHAHPISTPFIDGISFDMDMTFEEILSAIRSYVEAHPEKDSYFGLAYLETTIPPEKYNKHTLDLVCPDKPLLMIGATMHESWCNTKALDMAKVDKHTKDPTPDMYFYRDEEGNPTGRLVDILPHSIIADAIQPYDIPNGIERFKEILRDYRRLGITAVMDCAILDPSLEEAAYDMVTELKNSGELSCRFVGCETVFDSAQSETCIENLKRSYDKYHDDLFSINVLKILQDGCIEARSGAFYQDYLDYGETRMPVLYGEKLKQLFLEAAKAGFHIHLHALGDRSVHETLMAAKSLRDAGYHQTRITSAHNHGILDEDIALFGKYDVIGNFTPQWFVYKQCNVDALGEEPAKHLLRMNSVIQSGAAVTIGSDFPSDEIGMEPMKGVEMCQTRRLYGEPDAAPLPTEDECVSLENALKAITINGAYQLGMEDKIGSLEAGKYADFVILDKNLFDINVYQIHTVESAMTVFNGKIVYRKLS